MFFNKPVSPLDYFFRDIVLAVLYLFALVVVPLGSMVLALELDKEMAAAYATYIVMGLAFAGVGAVYFLFHRQKQTAEEKALKLKLKERMDAGEALVTETPTPLTAKDIAKIKKLKFWSTTLLIPAMSAALFFVYQATVLFSYYPLNLGITAVTGLLFAFLIYKAGQLLDKVIDKGEKTIVRGIITRKYYAGKYGFKIVLGRLPFTLQRYSYLASKVGDEMELDVLKTYGNWVLGRRKISQRISPADHADYADKLKN